MPKLQQTIPNYKNWSIVHDPVDGDTMQILKRIRIGYYKALGAGEWINMPEGTVYVLHGTVYRFTGKGLRYFEIIRKNHPITHWVKEQMETGNWTILESTYNIHDVHSPLTFPEG